MANYEVEVLVNGRPVRQFRHKGEVFVEGRKGSKFELKVSNNTWERIEVVPSVDGLSVLDGKPCGAQSEGYLVPARESIVIPGWRLNNSAVAEFIFQDKGKSYSSKMGHGSANAGAIGFMVFREKAPATIGIIDPMPVPQPFPQPWHPRPWQPLWHGSGLRSGSLTASSTETNDSSFTISSCNVAASASPVRSLGASAKSMNIVQTDDEVEEKFELGTGWGDELSHQVSVVEFERRQPSRADELIVVYYDTRKGLEARGIKVVKTTKKSMTSLPNAFPTYQETGAVPPPGWKPKRRR